ncbi:GntR family transcriptional regulator [Mariniblastus sp.]|nr:GntR family transcriptional regulator [Mariniblastus sp.]
MYFEIDTTSGLPVYEQVYRQVAFAIANGIIASGDLVPSVRAMAKDLAINPNTVARAYRDLQSQGVLEVVRGSGMLVTKSARSKCKSIRSTVLKQQISSLVDEARRSQLTDEEIRQLLESKLKKKR